MLIEPAALDTWITEHDRIEAQLGSGGDLQEIKATAAKGAENLLRIAGVMAVVEERDTITPALIERAAVLVEWYLAEALRVGHPVKVEARLLHAQRLLDWLHANNWQRFEARELQRKGPRFARKSAAQLKELLGILLEHRLLLTDDGGVFILPPMATAATGQMQQGIERGDAVATVGDTDQEDDGLSPVVANESPP